MIRGSGVDINRFRPTDIKHDENGRLLKVLLATRLLWDKGVKEFLKLRVWWKLRLAKDQAGRKKAEEVFDERLVIKQIIDINKKLITFSDCVICFLIASSLDDCWLILMK